MNITKMEMVLVYFALLIGAVLSAPSKQGNVKDFDGNLGIFDGKPVRIAKHPYMVSIVAYGDLLLGTAVILNENWILSTAYIAAAFGSGGLTIRAGSNHWNQTGQVVTPSSYVIHPKYDMRWAYDVAVFKLDTPLKLGKKVQAIQLGTKNLAPETVGEVLGWGPTSEASIDPSNVLRAANNTVWDQTSCKKVWGDEYMPCVFCVTPEVAGPCAGDYGSPLVVKGKVYGLFAGASRDCDSSSRLYTNIPVLSDWIKPIINQ